MPEEVSEEADWSQPTLTLHNKSSSAALLFRIQTTSPLSYRVKPSHGRIGPGSSVTIAFIMVSVSAKPDKFLIKYVLLDESQPNGEQNGESGDSIEQFAAKVSAIIINV